MAQGKKDGKVFFANSEAKPVDMLPGVVRRTLGIGEKVLLCEITLQKGAVVPVHSHAHEQVGYIVQGIQRLVIGGEERILRAGDSYVIESGLPHEAEVLEDSVAIDVFSPVREDYR